MDQADQQQKVGLTSLIQFFLTFSTLSFFMWWLLIALLSPLWGWYIWDMSQDMVSKAEFLESKNIAVSPTIEIFKNMTWSKILGAGSILGFLFYALPIALVVSFFEALARSFQTNTYRWIVRGVGLTWGLTPLGYAIHPFTQSLVLSLFFVILCGLVCAGLGWFFEKLKPKQGLTRKRKLVILGVMLLSVSHFLTHPVLHMIAKPDFYKDIKGMTLVRDWLLLDSKGSNWVNSWYYNHTAIAMEREKITTFQPMVVGLVEVNKPLWINRLSAFFSTRLGQRWTRIKYVELSHEDNIEAYLEKGHVDYVAFGDQTYETFKDRVSKWPELSYGFYAKGPNNSIPKEVLFTPQNFVGKEYIRWGDKYRETPVLKRKELIQDIGFNEAQSQANAHFKDGLRFLLGNSIYLATLLIFVLYGALLILFRVLVVLSNRHSFAILLLPILLAPFWITGLSQNFIFWTSEPGLNSASNELKILAMNQLYYKPNPKDIEVILQQELSDDLRVGMWQVATMGRNYRTSTPEVRKEILNWMNKVLENYHSYPFNFRYKLIESSIMIPNMIQRLNQFSKDEKQIYVRWYIESFGIGIESNVFK